MTLPSPALLANLPHLTCAKLLLAMAIAHAEGYDLPGSIIRYYNNPGGLQPGGALSKYRTPDEGWLALLAMVDGIAADNRRPYYLDMTLDAFARMWVAGSGEPHTGDYPSRWALAVSQYLNIPFDSTLREWFHPPPAGKSVTASTDSPAGTPPAATALASPANPQP